MSMREDINMTDAPVKIWAYAGSFKIWRDHKTDRGQRQTEYTRTDVADARIEELEMALLESREEIEGLYQDAAGASL
jgi:hypothetical protein